MLKILQSSQQDKLKRLLSVMLPIIGTQIATIGPYTGEAYSIPYGGGKALNFNAPIQTYETKEKKRGRKEVKITTSNEEDSYTYSVTISSNGSAYIHVQPIRRQPISFSGQIEPEE